MTTALRQARDWLRSLQTITLTDQERADYNHRMALAFAPRPPARPRPSGSLPLHGYGPTAGYMATHRHHGGR